MDIGKPLQRITVEPIASPAKEPKRESIEPSHPEKTPTEKTVEAQG